jgi:hypothetical protein
MPISPSELDESPGENHSAVVLHAQLEAAIVAC